MLLHGTTKKIIARHVEIMRNPLERARGMLKFEKAPEDYVAIFELPFHGFFPLVHTFGMKFAIGVAFCNKKREVIGSYSNVQPSSLRMPPCYAFGGARYLLEFTHPDVSVFFALHDPLEWKTSS